MELDLDIRFLWYSVSYIRFSAKNFGAPLQAWLQYAHKHARNMNTFALVVTCERLSLLLYSRCVKGKSLIWFTTRTSERRQALINTRCRKYFWLWRWFSSFTGTQFNSVKAAFNNMVRTTERFIVLLILWLKGNTE